MVFQSKLEVVLKIMKAAAKDIHLKKNNKFDRVHVFPTSILDKNIEEQG